jgi:hypothetical protein
MTIVCFCQHNIKEINIKFHFGALKSQNTSYMEAIFLVKQFLGAFGRYTTP